MAHPRPCIPHPSGLSARCWASLFAYAEKLQLDFPEDLEWKFDGVR